MKLVDRLIRVALVLMIVLSLFLSWKIWTNSDSKDLKTDATGTDPTLSLKQAKDVFSPVKLIYHDVTGKHYYTNKESLITSISKEVLDLSMESVKASSEKDTKQFFESQTKENSFELVFSSPLSLAYYFDINALKNGQTIKPETIVRRIVVALTEKQIYFLNDDNRQIYIMPFKGETTAISNLLKGKQNRYLEVSHEESSLPILYQFKEKIPLKKYSYILATQSYTTFSQAFFDKSEELLSNDDNQNSKDINLSNAEGGSLVVRYATGEVIFNGRFNQSPEAEKPSGNLYQDTFRYVEKIANTLGTVRYFESNGTSKVVYRNYVEGFPIFSEHSKGRVELTQLGKNVQIMANQETIQVPIPSEEEVILDNTEVTLSRLAAIGITPSTIDDLQIGYTWSANQETKQVVDLVPEWYVKYKGLWESVTVMEQTFSEKEGEK